MNKQLSWMILAGTLAACSSSATGVSVGDAGADSGNTGTDGAPSSGKDSGRDGTAQGCKVDADCNSFFSKLHPSPAGCAVASCNAQTGQCEVRPVDEDHDGYPTANCSVPGVAFTPGTDCNDGDPNLFPGQPEKCTTNQDGGVAVWPDGGAPGVCALGQVTCNSDGTESACTGEVPACTGSQTCVSGQCVGSCAQGETQCSGAGGAPATPSNVLWGCSGSGVWTQTQVCGATNTTCVGGGAGGDAGSLSSSCQGNCAPGETSCSGTNGVPATPANASWTCSTNGTWTNPALCTNTTCLGGGQDAGTVTGACQGSCAPGQSQCSGSDGTPGTPTDTLWKCGTDVGTAGTWVNSQNCASTTATCVNDTSAGSVAATCEGTCTPGQKGCVGKTPWMCDGSGDHSNGAACSEACLGGVCVACSYPSTQPCGDCGTQACNMDGSWGSCNGSAATTQPCNQCGTKSCTSNGTWGACGGSSSDTAGCGNCGSESCMSNGNWGNCNAQGCSPNTSTFACEPQYQYGCSAVNLTCNQQCGYGACPTINPQPFAAAAGQPGVSTNLNSQFSSGPNCFGSTNAYTVMNACPTGSSVQSSSCAMVSTGGVTDGHCSTSDSGNGQSVTITVVANSNCTNKATATLAVTCKANSCGLQGEPP